MALTAKQKRRLYHVLSEGSRARSSDDELLSSILTHRTETNYGNPSGGHGTSKGWRQQISGAGVKSRNRTNIRRQARYYFQETKGKRGTPGQISNAVQRSAYPQKASDPALLKEAREILAAYKAGKLGTVKGGKSKAKGRYSSKSVTTRTPGIDNSDARQQLKAQYLANRHDPSALLGLAQGLGEAKDVPGTTSTKTVRTAAPRGGGGRRDASGKRTSTDIERIAAKAKSMGLRVSGNRGVQGYDETSGHTAGSNHYRRAKKKGWQGALDISGDPRKMARLASYLSKRYGRDMEELIYRGPGSKDSMNIKRGKRVGRGFYSAHEDHVHAADLD